MVGADEGNARTIERWQAIVERFPDNPGPHLKLVQALQGAKRYNDAEAPIDLAEALIFSRRYDVYNTSVIAELVSASIHNAYHLRDWRETVRRWLCYAENLVTPSTALRFEVGMAFMHLKDYGAAEKVLRSNFESVPDHLSSCFQYAKIAGLRGDWEESLNRWRRVVQTHPTSALAYAGVGSALIELYRLEEAERFLADAMKTFVTPLETIVTNMNTRQIALNHARVARERGDYVEALRRWEALRAILPHDPAVEHGLGATRSKLQIQAIDHAADIAAAAASTATQAHDKAQGDDVRALMMRFESLGMNCEVGLVQRHFGAEPLGLLRWGVTDPPMLLNALSSGLEGIEAPGNLELEIVPGGEYFLRDKRYGLGMHTFIRHLENDRQEVLDKMTRRIRYLRDNLIGDLEDAAKIFVYKTDAPLDDETKLRLATAVKAFNVENKLLIVQTAPDPAKANIVEQREQGWIAGYLDRPSKINGAWNISFSSWLEICRTVHSQSRR